MPPRAKSKSKTKKETTEEQERISTSKEKILRIKRSIVAIVESMLEKEVSKDFFLKNCTKLCHADYDDVVQERSIEHLCGYALCSNTIKQTLKQKYHISRATNKVYDLTERKSFCSNQCYKASNYLKAQLSPIPLYMRKEEEMKVHLLSDCNNRGSAGEEIVFRHIIPREDIQKIFEDDPPINNFKSMLNEEFKNCADSLSELQIKEHVFKKQYIFNNQTTKPKESVADSNSESDLNDELDSDDSEDGKLFTNYDNLSSSSEKHMPIPETFKKALLISPLKSHTTPCSPVKQLSLQFVFNVFKDWMTEDTMKYLLGEKYVYGVKADDLFEKMTTDDPITPEKLSSIKNEYIELCCKIDSLPDDDLNDTGELDFVYGCTGTNSSKSGDVEESSSGKVFKKRSKRNSKDKGKKVTFASNVKSAENVSNNHIFSETKDEFCASGSSESQKESSLCEKNKTSKHAVSTEATCSSLENSIQLDKTEATTEETATESSVPEPGFPLVDSVSQNALRRQVLNSKLKSAYIDLLPIIGLHYTDIRKDIKKFVDTLSLTPTNVMFKPKEWKLISFILLRILTRTVHKDLHDEDQLLKLCEDPIMPISINLKEFENMVHSIISPENILSVPLLNSL